jgi:CheY-like chemotaxis protein
MASSTAKRGRALATAVSGRAASLGDQRQAGTAVTALPARPRAGARARGHTIGAEHTRRAEVPSGAPVTRWPPSQPSPQAVALAQRFLRIEERRRQIGCTQEQLARAVGVSRSTLARMLSSERVLAREANMMAVLEGLRRIELALSVLARASAPAAAVVPDRRAAKARAGVASATAPATRATAVHGWPMDLAGLERPTAQSATTGSLPRTCRLLVAEDDVATMELYRQVLAEESELTYQITVAGTARECLDRLEATGSQAPYDLLLMDLGLADVRTGSPRDGLLGQLVRHRKLLPRRVLIVSGISPQQLAAQRAAMAAIRAAYLSKPFDVDELLALVRGLCQQA